jgi:hypothetical protein
MNYNELNMNDVDITQEAVYYSPDVTSTNAVSRAKRKNGLVAGGEPVPRSLPIPHVPVPGGSAGHAAGELVGGRVDRRIRLTAATGATSFSPDVRPTPPPPQDHDMWHGYFTGPVGWNNLRVIATQANQCPIPYGDNQSCRATVRGGSAGPRSSPLSKAPRVSKVPCPSRLQLLCNLNTILSEEICGNGIDDDNNGWVRRLGPAHTRSPPTPTRTVTPPPAVCPCVACTG